jgi:Holliday junction resolvase RusA-like endonuclease
MQLESATANARPPKRGRGRPRYLSAVFTLQMPPGVNNLYANRRGGGRFRTERYEGWTEEAGWLVRQQRVPPIGGPVALSICAGIPKRKRDLDGIFKATCDLLTDCEIIEDDSLIVEIGGKWDRAVAPGEMVCTIRQVLAPGRRMSIEGRARLSAQRRGVPVSEWRAGPSAPVGL